MSPTPLNTEPSAAPGEDKLIAVLESPDAELKAKMDACRELGHLGTAKAVPALAALLGKEKLSHMARYGLEPIPDPSVDDALRKALGELNGRALAGVVASVGVRRDAKAVPALVRLLDSSDADVTSAAARSLARIAAPEGVTALAGKMAAAPAAVRMAVADACLECVEKLAREGRRREARPLYRSLRRAELSEHVKSAVPRRRRRREPAEK